MAKIVMSALEDGGVYKVFADQAELDASHIVQSVYTIVDLSDADLEKVLEETATFKVTDGVLGVADISPTWNKAEYLSAKDRLLTAYGEMDDKTKKASLESFIETVGGIDIDSLTIDSSVSFWKYVKSINGNVGYHPLQLL
tara:strand:+ start:2030 stop:2452 length:423 start_codon:yes stop_codon:yes gene_type:complete